MPPAVDLYIDGRQVGSVGEAGGELVFHPKTEDDRQTLQNLTGGLVRGGRTPAEVLAALPDRYRSRVLAVPAADEHAEPVEQERPYSCGAAALRYITSLHGDERPEAELRTLLGTTPEDGTSPDQMVDGAGRLGLDAVGTEGLGLPALERHLILGHHVLLCLQMHGTAGEHATDQAGHWVVAMGRNRGGLELMDPAVGETVTMRRDDLLRRWHDVAGDGTPYRQYGIVVTGKAA